MPEGLSATEVGKEVSEHARHSREHAGGGRGGRLIAVSEALLLSIVTIVAAWSGYSAAKWGTESSLKLAKASATRTKASRSFQESLTFRTADRGPVQLLVCRVPDAQSERDAPRREALPTRVPGRVRRLARDAPVHQPERTGGYRRRCRSTSRPARRSRVCSTRGRTPTTQRVRRPPRRATST